MTPELLFYNMPDGVKAFTTTRRGGFSKGNYSELNINPNRGDDPVAVGKNLAAVAGVLGISPSRIIRQHQVHKTEFRNITEDILRLTEAERADFLEGVDSVGTRLRGVCVGVFTADCIPVLLYDTRLHAVAAAHAGWRGTVQRIAFKTVRKMTEIYGTHPETLMAVIGPGITRKNFEVGQEVYEEFSEAHFDMDAIAGKYQAFNNCPGEPSEKWHIDLPECNRLQLLASGLKPENIFLSGIDTVDCHDDFFSARWLKTGFGTMFTGIMLP